MSIKKLFNQTLTITNVSSSSTLVESKRFIDSKIIQDETFHPYIDFSDPKNFAKFGSAEEYYKNSIERIHDYYPYDGSDKEKVLFELSSSYLDKYVFNTRYPKENGHVKMSYGGWGTLSGSIVNGYGLSNSNEFIFIKGAIQVKDGEESKPFYQSFDNLITYDEEKDRTLPLKMNLSDGLTVEFWLKKDGFDVSKTQKEVVLDLWNGESSSSSGYGRFTLALSGTLSGQDVFIVTLQSGSNGFFEQQIGTSAITTSSLGNWHHYALSFISASSAVTGRIYVDGNLNESKSLGSTGVDQIGGLINGYIGALQTSPSGSLAAQYSGKLSASLDDFRYWKTRRTSEEIYNNWFRHVPGGSNKEDNNTKLGVYYKFNEGILGTTEDSNVIDYSGRLANGTWTGYSSGARSTESAFVLSGLVTTEEKDPIIYSTHSKVVSLKEELMLSGSNHDLENSGMLYNKVPGWIRDEDENNNFATKNLYQIMSSYFDTLYSQISFLPHVKNKTYPSASYKPLPFANKLLENKGLIVSELFGNADVLEYFSNTDLNQVQFEKKIVDIKNLIYTNIYNNLEEIYKQKGTEGSVRNMLRCFGIDDEIVKLNIYTDHGKHYFTDALKQTSINKKLINLNKLGHNSATIFNTTSSINANSYVSGSLTEKLEQYNALTSEISIVVPKKYDPIDKNWYMTTFISASVFGMHQATTSSSDFTWDSPDLANFQVYLVRDKEESSNAKFVLKDYAGNINLETSVYKQIYSNEKWNLAVRIKPEDYPIAGNVVTSSNRDYVLEFYGVNHSFDVVKDEFLLTASLNYQTGSSYLSNPKRFYLGAHKTNFTGSTLQQSDLKFAKFGVWLDYLDNETIKQHNLDVTNKGTKKSFEASTIFGKDLEQIEVPSYELKVLDWDFETVTSSDSSGKFTVIDTTSGSVDSRFGWVDNITRRKHDALGHSFPVSSTEFVEKEIINSFKKELPEISYAANEIKIKSEQEEYFIEDLDVSDNFYALEKSMYQIISEEMLKTLSTAKEMSNLMGEAVERYRLEYKKLNHLRRMFFEDVEENPDFDRFTEYFKWIDSSVSYMVSQMFPVSVRFSRGISDTVESHIFERNKYQNKFPLISTVASTEGRMAGVGQAKYRWEFGHAPLSGDDNDHCLWQKERAKRSDITERETINQAILNRNNAQATIVANASRASYSGSTFAIRRFTKPLDLTAKIDQTIHAGVNYNLQKDRNYVWSATNRHSGLTAVGIPRNVMLVGAGPGQGIELAKDCNDVELPNEKKKFNSIVYIGKESSGSSSGTFSPINDSASYSHALKGHQKFPFNLFSGSVTSGYNSIIASGYKSNAILTNLHSDTTDLSNDIPIQGPFTQQWVGGHQSRHVDLNRYDTSLIDGETLSAPTNNIHNQYTRAEAWRLVVVESGGSSDGALGLVDPQYGVTDISGHPNNGKYPDVAKKSAVLFRDGRNKRSLNVSNIKTTTSSVNHGNFHENHEILTVGSSRKDNNLYFRDNPEISNYLPDRFTASLPQTTNVMSLIGIDPTENGNVWGTHANNLQPDQQLLSPEISGSQASGSFVVTGSTINGTFSSGSFRLNRQIAAATPSHFSFNVSGSHFAGTNASGSFSFNRSTTAPVSASIAFTVKGRTIDEVNSSGSFVVTGAFTQSAAATASFDVAGPPVGGERSYAIFDVGFENVHDGHTFTLGRDSSTGGVEIEISGGVTVGNESVSPFHFQKACQITSSLAHYYTSSVNAGGSDEAMLEFYVYVGTDTAIIGGTGDKYIYQSTGVFGSSKFADPAPVIEVYIEQGTNRRPIVKQYFKNTNDADNQGYWIREHNDDLVIGWNRIVILGRTSSRELNISLNGTLTSNSMGSVNADVSYGNNVLAAPTGHKLMGNGTNTWGEHVEISNFVYWNARGADSDSNIIQNIASSPIYPADLTYSSSYIRAVYQFGDFSGDTVAHPLEATRTTNIALTASFSTIGHTFKDSNFIFKKTPTEYFDDVKSAIENRNSSQFNVDYVAFNSSSTEIFQTKWPATSSAIVVQPGASTPNYQVNNGYSLNFARFFVSSKQETNAAAYQIAPTIDTGSFTNELSMSFRNLAFDATGSLQSNQTTNSIEDSSITIDGTTITFDHHANSQGGNQVRTYATTYHPCLSGSSFGDSNVNFKNNAYPSNGSLEAADDFSFSFWHARSSTNTQQEYLVLLDSAGGGTVAGTVSIKSTSTGIQIDAYQNASTYKRFTATFSSLGINEDDLNHYVFTFDVSSLTGVLYVNGVSKSLTTSGTATSFSHTYTEIRIGNALGGSIYELQGRLCQVSIWDKILTSTEAHELYHDGRVKDLYGHSSVENLVHWYKLGTEGGWPSVGSDLSSFLTIPDSTPRNQRVDLTISGAGSTNFTSVNGLPDNTVSNATFWTALNSTIDSDVADYNASNTDGSFLVTHTSIGTSGNGDPMSEDSDLISNLETSAGGGAFGGGAVDGHSITIDGITFEIDTNSSIVDTSTLKGIDCPTGTSNADFWNTLSQSIKNHTDFDTIAITAASTTATFSLTASTGGTNNDGVISNLSASFPSFVQTAGGVNQSGSIDGNYIVLAVGSGAGEQKKFIVESSDGSQSDDTPTGSFYVDSSTTTDAEFWNNLSQSIKDRGFGASYSAGSGQATFTVTSYKTASSGNTVYGSSTSGPSFAFVTQSVTPCNGLANFCGGADTVDNNDGHSFTLDGVTFEMDSNGTFTGGRTNIASSGSLTNTQIFNNITASIIANTVFDTVTYSVLGSTATFSVTSSVTGTVKNGSFTTGSGFTMVSQTAGGTNTSGSQYGNTLVIGNHGSDVTITVGNGSSPDASLSNTAWWNDLSQSIKTNTNYDIITIVDNGNNATFRLTSSVAGIAGDDTHSETGETFFNVVNSTGGSDAGDSSDGSSIAINDGTGIVSFVLDSDGTYSGDHNIPSSASLSDDQVFNALTQSIKDNTLFDTISMSPSSGNNRILSLTSSATGSNRNSSFSGISGDFTMISQTAGGTNQSGADDGDNILIDGKRFVLDNNSSGTDGVPANNFYIDCSNGTSNSAFWNSLSQSIKNNTVYDTISIASSTGTATFSLTSSTTGSALNVALQETGSSFTSLSGMAGATNVVPAVYSIHDVVIAVPTPTLRNSQRNRTVISSRFSAPGGVATLSNAYLDVYAREFSVYNNLNYRNLSVRGTAVRVSSSADGTDYYSFGGSGESGTIRAANHLDQRDGHKALLSRHMGRFGIDSRYAAELGGVPITTGSYTENPAYHGQQRNENRRPANSSTVLSPVLITRHDNAYINSPIPRSDFQYKWVTSSLGDNYSITSGKQRMYGYADPTGILSSSVEIDGDSGFVAAITFPTASEIFGE